MTNPDHFANGYNIGEQLLEALGIDKSRSVTKVVIVIQANRMVDVIITEGVRLSEFGDFANRVSKYKIVPKE